MPTGTVSEPDTALGWRLRDLRLECDLTQWQLAAMLNTRANRVSDWETGKHIPTLELLQRIAAVYEITVADLLDGVM